MQSGEIRKGGFMREIKFRAWDKKEKKIVGVQGICFQNDNNEIKDLNIGGIGYGVSYHNPIEDYELMQFTGLKDKNGKEIYEGDVIQDDGGYDDGVKYLGVVRFGENEKSPLSFWSDTSIFGTPDGLKISKFSEVIGNIYENPELVK